MNALAQNNDATYRSRGHYRGWLAWPAYLLFFMMLFVPTTYQPIKAVLLAIVLLMIGISALRRRRLHLHMAILRWTLLMAGTGLGFMMLGMVNGAPGALRVGTVYVLWPLVFLLILTGIDSRRIIEGIFRVMVFALIAISLYSLLYLLHTSGWLPELLYFEIDMGQNVGFYNGYVEFSLYNIATLNFLVPFLIAMVLTGVSHETIAISKLWLWIACLLGIVAAVLSGRKAVWLILIISPIVVFFARIFMPKRFKVSTNKKFPLLIVGGVIMGIALFLYVGHLADLDISMIWQNFLSGFDFSNNSNASSSARAEQFFALIDGWMKKPLFGAGHGASVAGSLRSDEMSWAYELSYVALLFHTGVVGMVCYGSGVIWIVVMGVKIMHSGHWLSVYILPVLVGMFCFLIANATNPYLEKFDYMWVIFLPVALINVWLLDNNRNIIH